MPRHLFLPLVAFALLLSACYVKTKQSKNQTCLQDPSSVLSPEQVLHLNIVSDPPSTDPRQVRELFGNTLCKMLYEGLTRIGPDGEPLPASAKEITLSEDSKTYTFELRESYWSNGDPLTAYDFEKTLKTTLSPNFPADSANLLYAIKNAKEAKEGTVPIEALGVQATGPTTLVIELSNPAAYFPQVVALPISFPVHASLREASFEEGRKLQEHPISNGPFLLADWQHDNEIHLTKNPSFWDAENVSLTGVKLAIVNNERTELGLFERGELDWVGSPLGNFSIEALETWKQRPEMAIKAISGTYWFRINTQAPPFDNGNVRRAFALAINRKDIAEHVMKSDQVPATGIVPPNLWEGTEHHPYFRDGDIATARRLLRDGLAEMGMTVNQLAPVTLIYAANERNSKIAQAVQQQWKEALGIDVQLRSMDFKVLFQNLRNSNYQIGAGMWLADFSDPSNFLDVFKYASNNTNNTLWEDPAFTRLLNQSEQTNESKERMKLLLRAEKLLVKDMPVIPLFHYSYCYVKQPHVKGVYITPIGLMEIRWASIEKSPD